MNVRIVQVKGLAKIHKRILGVKEKDVFPPPDASGGGKTFKIHFIGALE
ncbi:MAG: hypothetical protein OEX02_14735 [Cyclobacteriaceae bacterium]|nr:hypothetical protein [Cyclobacteriaceae bacterium]